MSIQAPQGILNIPNATLRVGKLAVDEVVGADTILNTVARNTILLVDDEAYHENKNWALKLPNAWAGEFECNTASAGNYSEFNFYNEGASSNVQGYNLTFNDTAVELRYDGTLLKTGTLASTITGTGVKKVRLMFERTILSVTVDGTLVFTHDDTVGPRPRVYSTTAGGFLNFFTDGGALKNLKIVNEKWMSDGTSNIAYVGGGEVAIGQSLNLQQVSNTASIKLNSNVVTEFPRSKKFVKFPRLLLTYAAQSSQGGYENYVVNQSSVYSSESSTGAYLAFRGNSHWLSSSNSFDGGDDVFNGTNGPWISIQLPTKIKLEYLEFSASSGRLNQLITAGSVYASNDGSTWINIGSLDNLGTYTNVVPAHVDFTHTTLYDRYLLHITANQTNYVHMEKLSLFGVPEYDPEADGVDVVVKSVPNVPNTDWLEVYYDAKDLADGALSTTSGAITGLGGTTINGTAFGDPQVSNGAFVFDGSGDYISGTLPSSANGDWVHSLSMWFKADSVNSANDGNTLFYNAGSISANNVLFLRMYGGTNPYIQYSEIGSVITKYMDILTGVWYHLTLTYSGGGWANAKMYINGELANDATSTDTTPLTLTGSSTFYIGKAINSSNPAFNGSIANFRLFNRALTQDEIYQLYAYQKEYFGHGDLGMTLKAGRLGIGTSEPRAMLDVRGGFYAPGTIVQVESSTRTNPYTNSGVITPTDVPSLGVTITPKFSTSKVLVSYVVNANSANGHGFLRVKRTQGGSDTFIGLGDAADNRERCTSYMFGNNGSFLESYSFDFLDSADSTTPITYQLQMWVTSSSYTYRINVSASDGNSGYYGRTSSSITVKEVCQ
jgi:hypothetical protein